MFFICESKIFVFIVEKDWEMFLWVFYWFMIVVFVINVIGSMCIICYRKNKVFYRYSEV